MRIYSPKVDLRTTVEVKKMRSIKCGVLGDEIVGKTTLVLHTCGNKGSFEHVNFPLVYDKYTGVMAVGDQRTLLEVWDTTGQESYDGLRQLSYPETDVFIICFSVDCPKSLENVRAKWHPEVQRYCPNTPIILVGTKVDLRGNREVIAKLRREHLAPVTKKKGKRMKREIGAAEYVECSSLTGIGLEAVFEKAIEVFREPGRAGRRRRRRLKCSIM